MELFALNPRAMIAPSLWIFLDWLFTIGVLYLSFYSVGYPASFGQVAIAFSVSIVVAIASFVPGGAGVLEGTLTATFAGLGIPLTASLLPIFLFRMSFYVVPAILSLLLARGAFAEVDSAVAENLV
jgi:phosphatidylglycerol lysyltransferase